MTNRRRGHRVLVIVENLPLPLDRRVWLECQALVDAEYSVSAICPRGPGDPPFRELDGVRIYTFTPAPPAEGAWGFVREFACNWLRTLWLVLKVARRDGFDVIQACNPPDTLFAIAAPYKLFGKRFVFDQHDLNPEVYESRFDRPSRVLLAGLRALERGTYLTADRVISTNDSYRHTALTRGRQHPDRVVVVRSGPDPERMRRIEPRRELKRGRSHLLVYLGVMGPQDGVDLALRAIDHLVHRLGRDDFHAAFLGFGDCFDDLVALCHTLELDAWVSFPGRADGPMIADYLSTADLGIDPDPLNSLNDVSTMNKVMEYMAFGLPVVAFDLKETRVSGGDAAVYVEPNDVEKFAEAVAELLDDPTRRARLGGEGRRRVVDQLAWEHQVPAYVGVYDDLLRGGTSTAERKFARGTRSAAPESEADRAPGRG